MADALLEAGAAALKAGDWAAAREAFGAALKEDETPEALNGLGNALWWLGETTASVEARERAYAGFRRTGDHTAAADCALGLCIHYRANVGNEAAAAGWLARATTLIEENGLAGPFRAFLRLMQCDGLPPDDAERIARDVLADARADGDVDIELCAMAQLGSTLVSLGRIDEGVALLDEAMAGSLGGEGDNFDTIVFTSCNMIGSCTRCAEFERAIQWIRAADRFTQRYGCPFLYLYCRTHYGLILIATGDWTEAETQLTIARKESEGSQLPLNMYATAALASLRFAQGRLEDAEALIEGFGGQGPAAPVAAGIALARNEPELAASIAERALEGADQLERALLSELLGVADMALGRAADAERRGRDLAATPGLVGARANRLVGTATGDRAHLDTALREFARIGLPYEVARTRLAIANAARASEPKCAEAEAREALAAFEGLGAGRDADAAAALLRALGVKAARSGPKGLGTLTKRETEVLELVAEGLPNPEIAERLYLSRKTVEHHVASILAKLGVRNRAEAARASARK